MKLNNRLFWKKSRFLTNYFSCFNAKKLVLVFLVGLFALSGLFAADAKIVATDVGVSSSWSSATWVDSNGNSVQAPINTGDDAILNAMNGAITLTLENDLTITDLFVYGEKGVTINLNGRKLTVNGSIFIGSGPGHTLITTDEANCLGNLTFTNGSVVTNIMNTTSYGDPAKTPDLTKNVLTIGDGVTSFSVNNCWYVGDYTEAQITNPGNAQLNITRNIDGAPNFVKVLSDQLTTLGIPENVFYWTGSNGNSWTDVKNWTGGNGSYPMSTGDVAVFENTSDITITNFSANDNSTIYFRAPNSTGTITFTNMQNASSKKIFVESGKYVLTAAINSLNVAEGAEVTFTGGWLELGGDLRNEGTVNINTQQVQVNNYIINKGVINLLNTAVFKVNNVYRNEGETGGTIKATGGGTFSVGNNVTGEVVISKLDATAIKLTGTQNAKIKVLSLNNNSVGNITVQHTELPKGEYESITVDNAPCYITGTVTVNGNLTAGWSDVVLEERSTLTVNDSLSGNIQLKDGAKCAFNGFIAGQNISFTPYKNCTIEYIGTTNGEITSITLPNNLENDVEITIKSEKSVVTLNQGVNNNKCNLILEGKVNLGTDGSNQIFNIKSLICNANSNSNIGLNGSITIFEKLENNGTVTQTGTLTINGDFDSGDDSSSTYASVTLAPTSDEVPVTVSGFGKITTLNSGNNLGGKTINFNDNITITGTNSNLKGSGNENENKLNKSFIKKIYRSPIFLQKIPITISYQRNVY